MGLKSTAAGSARGRRPPIWRRECPLSPGGAFAAAAYSFPVFSERLPRPWLDRWMRRRRRVAARFPRRLALQHLVGGCGGGCCLRLAPRLMHGRRRRLGRGRIPVPQQVPSSPVRPRQYDCRQDEPDGRFALRCAATRGTGAAAPLSLRPSLRRQICFKDRGIRIHFPVRLLAGRQSCKPVDVPPARSSPRSRASSSPVWYRSSGLFARHLRMMLSSFAGMDGFSFRGGTGSVCTTFRKPP